MRMVTDSWTKEHAHSADDFLAYAVGSYFEDRGLVMPNSENALHFLVSEVGELSDAVVQDKGEWIRNNPEKTRDIADEVGDCLMMLTIFCIQRGISPVDCMVDKMRKGIENHIEGELK